MSPRRPLATRTLALLLALLGSGCADLPPLPPDPPLPQQWQAAGEAHAGVVQPWLAAFADAQLNALVAEALAHNHDLQGSALRLAAARERSRISQAALLPTVSAGLDATRSRSVSSSSGRAATTTQYSLEGTLSWELDLWGRLAHGARGAVADEAASAADLAAARLSLAANVAKGWFRLLEAQQQEQLARETAESFRNSLAVVEERYRGGLGSALDLRLARTDLATAHNTLALRQRERDGAVRTLELLLGRYPSAALDAHAHAPLPETLPPVPAGLPAQLLARRPDLRAAQWRLAAAGERLDQANRNRLPTISLTARGGDSSAQLRDLLDWNTLVWSLIGGVTQPLFQGGRLKAEAALAGVERRSAWTDYAKALLSALQEVEQTLAAEPLFREQQAALTEAAGEARQGAELALSRYRQGLTDVITLLESQRRAHQAESTRLAAIRARLENRVTLHLALGGPFDDDDVTTAAADITATAADTTGNTTDGTTP